MSKYWILLIILFTIIYAYSMTQNNVQYIKQEENYQQQKNNYISYKTYNPLIK
jgi:hypothetical protein